MDFDGGTLAFNITRRLITVPEKPENPKHFHKTQTASTKPIQFQKLNKNTSRSLKTKTPPEI